MSPRVPGAGPTGRFPEGKARPDDQGELGLGVTHADGKVFVDFGVDVVEWIGMPPATALTLAAALKQHAELAEEERKAAAAVTP